MTLGRSTTTKVGLVLLLMLVSAGAAGGGVYIWLKDDGEPTPPTAAQVEQALKDGAFIGDQPDVGPPVEVEWVCTLPRNGDGWDYRCGLRNVGLVVLTSCDPRACEWSTPDGSDHGFVRLKVAENP